MREILRQVEAAHGLRNSILRVSSAHDNQKVAKVFPDTWNDSMRPFSSKRFQHLYDGAEESWEKFVGWNMA
jgi:hypothetical protein